MSELPLQKRVEALEAKVSNILEGLNNILTEVTKVENAEQIQKEAPIDLEQIKWVRAEGEKGAYEKSDDVNCLEFKKLVKSLNEHDKKMTISGYFVWLFENGAVVGRKKRAY